MKDEILGRAIALGIIFAVCGLMFFILGQHDRDVWNNGYHSCGGQWQYIQPIGHSYNTSYLYECDYCGKTHEFQKKR